MLVDSGGTPVPSQKLLPNSNSIAKILLGFNNACFVLSSSVVSPPGDWLGGEDGMEPMIKETIVFSWQPSPLFSHLYSTLVLYYIKVALDLKKRNVKRKFSVTSLQTLKIV